MNLQAKPTEANFKFRSIKSKSRDSLEVRANKIVADGSDSYTISEDGNYPVVPHPDLFEQLDKLKPFVISHFGMRVFEKLVNDKKFNADKAQKKLIKDLTEEQISTIRITGVGIDANQTGAIITSVINGEARNTKKLYFHNSDYGAELEDICDAVVDETYKYMYEEKQAQQEVKPPQEPKEGDQQRLIPEEVV